MEQSDIGQLGCRRSLVQHFESSKFSDKQDVGPATWAHINGYIHACKCTETFRTQNIYNSSHSRVSTDRESS